MTYDELDMIVLTRDFPELALRTGDIGTIVMLYDETMVEVEFRSPIGDAPTIAEVPVNAMRLVQDSDFQRATPPA
jgi:Domain of unknown function (DUF4926)